MALSPQIQKVVGGGAVPLTNYDYIDIADGTGIVNFYLGNSYQNGASAALLSRTIWYPTTKCYSRYKYLTVSGAGFETVQEMDFDVQLNTPRIISGKALLNVTTGINISDITAGTTHFKFLNARLRKWNGTAETEIAQASGNMIARTAGEAAMYYNQEVIQITVPQTTFKTGEVLRLTLEHKGMQSNDVGLMSMAWAYDPYGRAASGAGLVFDAITFPTTAIIKIPFKLDI